MSSQNMFNSTEFDALEAPPHMYFLEIDGHNIIENPVESQAIPLNMILNPQNDHILLPLVKGRSPSEQLCVYVDPNDVLDDQHVQNYINNQRHLSVNGNGSLPTTTEASSHIAETNGVLQKPSTSDKTSPNNSKCCKELESKEDEKKTLKKDQGFVHFADRIVPPRAIAVLPAALQIRRGSVTPKRLMPERVRFGPVQGVTKSVTKSEARDILCNAVTSRIPVFFLKSDNNVTHIDVSDRDKSNWFSLLPLGTQSTANVWLYEDGNKLYGITAHSVKPKTPLAIGYSKHYAQEHNLPSDLPILDLTRDLPELQRRWWCYECHRALPTASQLQYHVDIYHHKEKVTSMGRYRCRQCTRTFGRRFTLKRHMARYCTKKPEKVDNNKTNTISEIGQNVSLNVDDTRLPSDESLQNFTSGIDFSTNLFDTDRMAGLDISGSSRSETEFNSYGIPFKDNNDLDVQLGQLAGNIGKSGNEDQEKKENNSSEPLTILISCLYCKQTILREKKRKHLRECPQRKFDCMCGVAFNSSEKLARHVQTEHREKQDKNAPKTETNDEANSTEFKCEKCPLVFKRRGMFVNHMWRVHRAAASAPLQRRVRLYPCGACAKLYRTAAKRDAHRAHHHPGANLIRAQTIESGLRACEPAACEACPRQYATRAKLLQHVRQHHPDLAPPLKNTSKVKHQQVQKEVPSKSKSLRGKRGHL
ncbi:PR domain zinc finger protein 10-like [Ostrinia furnacalis]|uniref:PR domain zinc finger protein 10-like n=1 Tax=Ostrinia furnacalis TaxID=93504 RepID=UPI00103D75AA|nr:PR domain zinc finger protein 10-like [Ostrinia furnacalis]